MRTTFSGIELARRALQAQQRSLDVVGHNVANANTPGYARQVAVHQSSKPYPTPQLAHNPSNGQIGTGVEVSQITRMRDEFVETRLRQENHNAGYWQTISDGLEQVELILNEPSDNNIHHALDRFWDSVHELNIHPDNEAARAVVIQRAEVLAETIRHARSQLGQLRDNMNELSGIKMEEVNSLTERIAKLNDQIGKVAATGNNANDLKDKRDVLLEDLSKITNIEVVEDSTGMVLVSISGATLVQRNQHFSLTQREASDDVYPSYNKKEIVWQGVNTEIEFKGGELAGILDFRDNEAQNFIDDLNNWTADLINVVNVIHQHGYDLDDQPGAKLFEYINPTDEKTHPIDLENNPAADPALSISANINDPRKIAASAHQIDGQTVEGNGDIALLLATLRHSPPESVLGNLPETEAEIEQLSDVEDKITFGESFTSIISELGVRAQKANTMVENEQALLNHLYNLRESVSGVSLDEEMADMIRYQHAYSAAARVLTTMDEALELIINRLGLVGR